MLKKKKRIINILSVIICICTLMGSIGPVRAFAAPEYKNQKVVRLGYYSNDVFQEGAGPDEIKRGYAYEYYQKIAEYTEWRYEYVYGDFDQLYRMLEEGKIDLLGGIAYKEDRTKNFLYPDMPMGKENYNLMKKNNRNDILTTSESLNGKKIGVLDSIMVEFLESWLKERSVQAEIVKFKNYADLYVSFEQDRFDVLMVEGASSAARRDAEIFATIASTNYYIVANSKRQDLIEQLNYAQSAIDMEEPYYVTALYNKYYANNSTPKAFGSKELEWIDGHNSVRVAFLKEYLPYSDVDSEGKVIGAVTDILPAMFDKLGLSHIRIEYQGYDTYKEIIDALHAGRADIAFPVSGVIYFSEKDQIHPSNTVVNAVGSMVYMGEYSLETEKTAAINKSNQMQEYYLRTYFPNTKLVYCESTDACLEAVISGKAGFTTLNGYRAGAILKNTKYRSLTSRQLTVSDDRCFGVETGNEGLLKVLNKGINAIGQNYINSTTSNYAEGLYVKTPLDIIRQYFIVIIIIVVIIVALIVSLILRDNIKNKRFLLREEEKNKELERANAAKSAFLARMSHDIRTPLNGIIGLIEIGEAHSDDKELIDENRKKAKIAADHLLSLISDVLDLSKMDDENVSLAHEPFDILALAKDVLTITKLRCVESGIALIHDDCRPYITHRYVYGSPLHLRQILINIFGNAIKYNKPGGSVSCNAQTFCEDGKTVYLNVVIADTGIGMSEEFLEHLYEPFSQEHSDARSTYNGTGLGMAIVKRLVDKMNGSIDVMSRPGTGSSFTLTIPLDIAREEDIPKVEKAETIDFEGIKVLLVEDNELNQEIAKMILEDMGAIVTVACDGEQACDAFINNDIGSFDIILMDLMMPNMNGYEAAKTIRDYPREDAKTVPIFAMTANAFAEDVKKCLEAGMDGHLAKPIEIDKIREALLQIRSSKGPN